MRAHPFTRYAGQFDNDVSSMSRTIAGRVTCGARWTMYASARATTVRNAASYLPAADVALDSGLGVEDGGNGTGCGTG